MTRNIVTLIFSLLSFVFIISSCESAPSPPKRDIEYNIDNVRILIPREFEKVSSKEEIKEKFFPNQDIENLNTLNQLLYNALTRLNNNNQHWFVKFKNDKLEFITLKTDGPSMRPTPLTTSRTLEVYQDELDKEYMTPDSTYRHVLIQDKLSGANEVVFFKFKYFHSKEKNDWFTTNYLIHSNNRTVGLSLFSQNKDHNDLEDYMQFIKIK